MSLIRVQDLTFAYDGSFAPVFSHMSFSLDTDWKTGFIGRNGKGKTTLLRLLSGRETPNAGSITASVDFEYFPYEAADPSLPALEAARGMIAPFTLWEERMDALLADGSDGALAEYGEVQQAYQAADGYIINELITREAGRMAIPEEALARPLSSFSPGERTRLTLAALFLRHNSFLLIDEPTNHLDLEGRRIAADYLAGKSGFILVSHDRDFLDRTVDHILCFNRETVEIQQGNWSSWKMNRDRQDADALARNKALRQDIARLTAAAEQAGRWSASVEATKTGAFDSGYVGHKAAKMMKRSKAIEKRRLDAVEEKKDLLKDVEEPEALKLMVLPPPADPVLSAPDLSLAYGEHTVVSHLRLELHPGERLCLVGPNGCGKSTVLHWLLGDPSVSARGTLRRAPHLCVSAVPQDAGFLHGSLRDHIQSLGAEESLFKAILRKLDFTREALERPMEEMSSGMQKKVLLASSLARPAHLFLWDEPLNFLDILSRLQMEDLLLEYAPTMIFVEHDAAFCRKIATRTLTLPCGKKG